LDAGCGTGLLAVPLAKKVKKVTALDSSDEMLRYCRENAAHEKIANIEYIHKKIEQAIIGKDIEKHDVVIASRSMGHEHDLSKFLIALNNAAGRYAYLTWGASDRHFDIDLHKALGRKYGETRTYIIIYNLLYQLGIRANIEIFECSQTGMAYSNPAEAAEQLIRRYKNMKMDRELSSKEEIKLREFLNIRLQKTNDGTYIYPVDQTAKHALIWWNKSVDIPAV
jgi:SAM-dependent methyltransferase